MRSLALLSLAVLAACTPARPPSAGSPATQATSAGSTNDGAGKVTIIGDDVAAVKEYFSRWLSPGTYGPADKDTTIWIGQLPEDVPLPLPIPESARIIGSMQGPYTALEILFDIDQPFEEVREFYRKALTADGWAAPESVSPGGGFVDAPFEVDGYCLEKRDAYLTLSGRDVEGAPADVRLSVMMPAEYTPCDAQAADQPPDAYRLLPALSAPSGVEMRSGGAGSGDGYAEASAGLRTSLTPSDLLTGYNEQLAAAEWTLSSSQSAETFAWSTWTVPETDGQQWNGLLLILQTPPESGELFALLRVTEKR